MSELEFYLSSPRPAIEPIVARGNVFWREDRRFLIRGVYYSPKQKSQEYVPPHRRPRIDPLTDEYLNDLHVDIPIIQELGFNTVSVSHLDAQKLHHQALAALARAGLYVVVNLLPDLQAWPESVQPGEGPLGPRGPGPDTSLQAFYREAAISRAFTLVDQLARYPNVLAFVVQSDSMQPAQNTKMAQVLRASVRDIKRFLRSRPGGRPIPVGVSNAELLLQRKPALQYFTAGADPNTRVDFFAPQSWSWAYKSSFQISGWRSMVNALGDVPVPMFLHAYGAYVRKLRIWEEVDCLFSKDMTGIFSGGIAYQFFEDGTGYDLVELDARGVREKKRGEFNALRQQMQAVKRRRSDEVYDDVVKDYEGWIGGYPEVVTGRWHATPDLPDFPGDWEKVKQQFGLQEPARNETVT